MSQLGARKIELPSSTTIEDAFMELSGQAMALWIRLHMVPGSAFAGGRRALARTLGVPYRTFDRLARELELKAYLRQVRHRHPRPGQPTEFVLQRRAIIAGPNRFVRLDGK